MELYERERRVEKILTYSSEMLKRAHQIDNVNLWDLLRVVCSLFWLPLSLSLANSGSNRYYRNIQNCLNDKQTSNSQVKRDGKVYTAKRGFCVGNLLQTFCRAIENFMLMSLALSLPPSFRSHLDALIKVLLNDSHGSFLGVNIKDNVFLLLVVAWRVEYWRDSRCKKFFLFSQI